MMLSVLSTQEQYNVAIISNLNVMTIERDVIRSLTVSTLHFEFEKSHEPQPCTLDLNAILKVESD